MPGTVHGSLIRERGLALRGIGAALAARFHASQVGTVRPGLTLEDGTLVVTDNYLKLRVPPGTPRNTRVRVRIGPVGPSFSSGVLESVARPDLKLGPTGEAGQPAAAQVTAGEWTQ